CVGRGELIPGGESVGGAKTKGATEIDDPDTSLQQHRHDFRGNFVRRGQEGGSRGARGDVGYGKRAERRFTNAAELRKQLGEALFVLGVANVEDRRLDGGMA